MSITTLDTLRRARELLSEPGSWTQGTSARSSNGTPVCPSSSLACSWCIVGAIQCIGWRDQEEFSPDRTSLAVAALMRFAIDPQRGYPAVWNDDKERKHAEVLGAFDKTIAALEKEQS